MDSVKAVKQIEVSAAVIIRGGEVLLTSRDDHGGRRYWEFPGGKREAGETYAACLRRELHEELGIEVRVFDTIYCIDHEYPGKMVHLRFLRCLLPDETAAIVPREGQECRWVAAASLAADELLPADAPLAAYLRQVFA